MLVSPRHFHIVPDSGWRPIGQMNKQKAKRNHLGAQIKRASESEISSRARCSCEIMIGRLVGAGPESNASPERIVRASCSSHSFPLGRLHRNEHSWGVFWRSLNSRPFEGAASKQAHALGGRQRLVRSLLHLQEARLGCHSERSTNMPPLNGALCLHLATLFSPALV